MGIYADSDNTVTIAQCIKCPSYYIRMHVLFCLGIYSRNLKDRAFCDYLCQCNVPCAGIYMCVSCKVAVVSIFYFPDYLIIQWSSILRAGNHEAKWYPRITPKPLRVIKHLLSISGSRKYWPIMGPSMAFRYGNRWKWKNCGAYGST